MLHLVASNVDGQRDLGDIADRVSESFGRQVSSDNVRFLVDQKLRPLGLVRTADGSVPKLKKADPLLALRLKTVLVPERAVTLLTRLCRPLFWPPVMLVIMGCFIAFDVWYFGVHGVAQGVRHTLYDPAVILLVYVLLVVSVGWHEVGHATACAYGGAKPGIIGFGVYIVWPAFYTDVTDAYRLGKGGRVRTDLGGIYFNIIFVLATAAGYFMTHYEPLLLLVLMQHLLIFYQFMPFLRLDGYYVISDLTGVPDLFARIKPTLHSVLPWRKTSDAVSALKPWVRTVVTSWVLLVVPVLLYGFTMMVITAPRVIATTYDSALLHWAKLSSAFGNGNPVAATANSLQMALLVLPVAGMSVTFTRVVRRLAFKALATTRHKPVLRTVTLGGMVCIAAASAWLLFPNGEYRPIQPGERGIVQESFSAAASIATGRPGLTQDRQNQLDGAPFSSKGAGGSGQDPLEQTPVTTAEETRGIDSNEYEPGAATTPDEDTEDTGQVDDAPSPSVEPTPEEATPTPTPEASTDEAVTPTPEPTEE